MYCENNKVFRIKSPKFLSDEQDIQIPKSFSLVYWHHNLQVHLITHDRLCFIPLENKSNFAETMDVWWFWLLSLTSLFFC